MQPILIRGLKRSFAIAPDWIGPSLAALRTTPDLPGPEPVPEAIAITPVQDRYRVVFPSSLALEGSLRECMLQVDARILRQAVAAEAAALILPAAIVRSQDGERMALIGGPDTGKTWISLALMSRGWQIEGDAKVVVRLDGLCALPRTIRIKEKPGGLPAYLRRFTENSPLLPVGRSRNMHVVDPKSFGSPWQLRTGAVSALVFLDLNAGEHGAIACLGRDAAFRRALILCSDHINGPGAAGLRLAIARAPAYRLQVGCPERAAQRLVDACREGLPGS